MNHNIMNNLVRKYNNLCEEIKEQIDKLTCIGINVLKYDTLLSEIKISFDAEIKERLDIKKTTLDKELEFLANFGMVDIYNNAINRLEKLKSCLTVYDYCFRLNKYTSYIDQNIDKVSLNELVKKCIEVLKILDEAVIIDYNEVKEIVESSYKTIYRVIQKEVFVNNESTLMNTINQSNDIHRLDVIIKEDIKNKNLLKVDRIKQKCDALDSDGLNATYFDLELIKLIVFEAYKDDIRKKYSTNLENIYYENSINYNNVLIKAVKLEKVTNETQSQRGYLKEIQKGIKERIVSVVLSSVYSLELQ